MRRTALLPLFCAAALAATPAAIDPSRYLDDVRFLASPEMRGRASGSREVEKAAAFRAGTFHEFGLKPLEGKSYYQAFPVTTSARLGKGNRLRFTADGAATPVQFPGDFIPLHFSSAAKVRAG